MRKLILIRHAETEPTDDLASREWPLTAAGRATISALAESLRPFNIDALFTSTEQKAIETGAGLSAELNIAPADEVADFDEHERPYLADNANFEAMMAHFFAAPSEVVFGTESAFDARGRFASGIYDTQDESPNGTIAIVTHGTVMALFIARCMGVDAFAVWQEIQQLGMPCYAVLSLPDFEMLGFFRCERRN